MLHLYLKLTALLLALFTLLSAVLLALGSTQPLHPALRGFIEGCEGIPQPCWYGIIAGQSTKDDVAVMLNEAGYVFVADESQGIISYLQYRPANVGDGCSVSLVYGTASPIISNLRLFQCGSIFLADILTMYGIPDSVFLNESAHGIWTYAELGVIINFSSGFAAYAPVDTIEFTAPLAENYYFTWHGFATFWRYCQLEPVRGACS
jgi:hypothetical protein